MNKIIKKIIDERQTVKAYNDEKIKDEDWNQIKEMIRWSPSSIGWEPYRVLVINKNNPLREILKPMMWNQGVITEADKLIVFISLNKIAFSSEGFIHSRMKRKLTEVVGLSDEETKEKLPNAIKGLKDTFLNSKDITDEWSMKQTYIALGNAMTAATILDIGTTPIEGFSREEVTKLFLEKELMTEEESISVFLAFGYPKSKTAYAHYGSNKRVRETLEEKFNEI